jgi:hypothetical protein
MTAARKMPVEAPPEPKRMSTRELLAEGAKRVNFESHAEAAREYGDDFARELADLEAGRHPSQIRKRAG